MVYCAFTAGSKFSRTAYLGLTKQELLVRLSDDCSALQWKTENTWTKSENGNVSIHVVDSRDIPYGTSCTDLHHHGLLW